MPNEMKRVILSIVFIVFVITGFGQETNGLVAKYTFDRGQARDEAGSNNGIVAGAVKTKDRFGRKNKALYFNGKPNSYVNLGTDDALKPESGSISLWVNIKDISKIGRGTSHNPIIIAKNTNAPDHFMEGYGLWVNMNNRKIIALTTESGTRNQRYFYTESLDLSTWYHLVMTYDDDSMRLYLNNRLVKSIYKGFRSTFSASDSVMVANAASQANYRFFNGIIDDIRIYNRVLNEQEVYQLYNETVPEKQKKIKKKERMKSKMEI